MTGNCEHCGKNLSLVGRAHNCTVPVHGLPGKTKVTWQQASNGALVDVRQTIVNNTNEHLDQIKAVINTNAARQAKWRKANTELNRQRAKEGMRKRRAGARANA